MFKSLAEHAAFMTAHLDADEVGRDSTVMAWALRHVARPRDIKCLYGLRATKCYMACVLRHCCIACANTKVYLLACVLQNRPVSTVSVHRLYGQ